MAGKEIKYGAKAREKMMKGVDTRRYVLIHLRAAALTGYLRVFRRFKENVI